eukprot:Gb_03028 [translate_table: standard]
MTLFPAFGATIAQQGLCYSLLSFDLTTIAGASLCVARSPSILMLLVNRSTEVERSVLEDLRNRAHLGSSALPSVSFYTFINTHNSLNCASISQDGALIVGGFSDSSLKACICVDVWNMAKMGEQHGSSETGTILHLYSCRKYFD